MMNLVVAAAGSQVVVNAVEILERRRLFHKAVTCASPAGDLRR